MKILNAEFMLSCAEARQWPKTSIPEIAFVGRSNVGKSSLLNALMHRRALASVSRTPGKTRLINFFRVTTDVPFLRELHCVDLPGYGYAKVSKSTREQWAPMIEQYLRDRQSLAGIVMLVDVRGPESSDVATWRWLGTLGRPVIVTATKLDKLRRGERQAAIGSIQDSLDLENEALIATSAETKEGIPELWAAIRTVITDQAQ